jgi:hypothetical protein
MGGYAFFDELVTGCFIWDGSSVRRTLMNNTFVKFMFDPALGRKYDKALPDEKSVRSATQLFCHVRSM